MQELAKTFNSKEFEERLYKKWEESGAFQPDSDPQKPAYALMMPPPNATGTLHLGHATMLAIEDILVRYHRMKGHATLYLPGTDHAAIATESVVIKKLQEEGMKNPRETLGREGLLNEIKVFVENSKATIRNQVRKMGTSCDWSRERYTFSDDMNHAVNTLFKMMYDDGLIYRGDRIVNWDPKMQTTVADDELEYMEEKSPFYIFKYGPFEIGTSRPETKFGDKVVVMHPEDPRYAKYKHGEVIGPFEWINGPSTATVIKDEAIDMEFGTGVMTITPWHDMTDFEIAERHKLEKIQVIDEHGRLLPIAGEFAGMKIQEARGKIVEKLAEKGLLLKTDENYVHNVAVSYRGKGKVEPQIMKQWFVDVNKAVIDWKGKMSSIKEVLQDVVHSGMIRIVPDRFDKIYFHWINNLRDWCISRQIWWGHRIPVWYKNEQVQVSENSPGEGWIQDEDTLDTWYSSGLWTFSTLGWPEKTPDLLRFTPSNVLETGYDILFFWVARMILQSTYALRKTGFSEEKSLPFKDVYLHGLIRDIRGKKMSKSHPETCIDPLDMIEKYGTDAIRLSLVIGGTPGNDMRLYEEKISGFRNFVNKIWNGARFVLLNLDPSASTDLDPSTFSRADKWILTRLNEIIEKASKELETYQFSEAGMSVYDFFWGEYCDWYVEMSKVNKNPAVLKHVLQNTLKLLHPFMPFVTEAVWEQLEPKELLITSEWPRPNPMWNFAEETAEVQRVMELVSSIRSLRAEANVDATKKIHAIVYAHEDLQLMQDKADIIKRLGNLGELELSETGPKPEKALAAFVGDIEIFLPLADLLDFEQEQKRITKEIQELERYIENIERKLENPGFVQNAPQEILTKEKEKLNESKNRLEKHQTQLKTLTK
ncbi:valine--tRNA ligase [Candidatus Peregrinibacteria bacterium]|nr:MAG: valine--tRNA ligase [Candidatus Peregrinibacteria bacterium]